MAVRADKQRQVEALAEELSHVPHAFLVDFRGLDVAAATDLRRRLRERRARFRVVKNRLALRALEGSPLDQVREAFQGQTAIAYTDEDVVALAKTLKEFAQEHEVPRFKAGLVDGQPISAEQFATLADLPPRDELLAKALFLMQYPVRGLVTALSGLLRNFVVVLEQIRQQREQQGDEAAPAAADAAGEPAAGQEEAVESAAAEGSSGADEEPEPEADAAAEASAEETEDSKTTEEA